MASGTPKISSSVLDMKFMQRTKKKLEEKERKKQEIEEKKKLLARGILPGQSTATVAEEVDNQKEVTILKSMEELEDLAFGRMSFKGFNPEVEKLMEYYRRLRSGEQEDDSDDEKEIGDEEMATAMSSSIGKKFMTRSEKAKLETFIDETHDFSRKRYLDVREKMRKRREAYARTDEYVPDAKYKCI